MACIFFFSLSSLCVLNMDVCIDLFSGSCYVSQTSASDLKVGGPELAKWDIEPFIRRKSANMPELALEKVGGCFSLRLVLDLSM